MSEPFFTWSQLAEICQGTYLLPPGSQAPPGVTAVWDDSRATTPGSLFVAIKGEFQDGHRHALSALRSGACALCLQEAPEPEASQELLRLGVACLLVKDSLAAFQALARAHRQKFPALFELAITGSSGKTSIKELCAALFERRWPGRVLKTQASTNNHYGLPRNLLRLQKSHAAAVLELGSNHPGEIAELVALSSPHIAIISNIGQAHLEFFHDLEGVAKEKFSLFTALPPEGCAVFPYEARGYASLQAALAGRKYLSFGDCAQADLRAEYLGRHADSYRVRLTWKQSGLTRLLDWHLGGTHQAQNAAAAAAAATLAGISPDDIILGLQNAVLPGERMQVFQRDGITWCNDAYNANPDSALASLYWFAELSKNAKTQVAILGDMRELGASSAQAHLSLLQKALDILPKARIVCVGKEIRPAALGLKLECFDDLQAVRKIKPEFSPGCHVLLKASNGLKLYQMPNE
ncbi:MAG: UDP-N-acetylmuramoyl-tripeptide--D-alanyl-D-alanine ligase [Lentisphaeria bacterium]|nr:UDP-N-acetylmuramoyl-tripeptide--D-alanyl-D-alanine ligase [Lentisphaeria bacterium]NLZ60062.1 UDP-N-acetylmuramoyl-tripeptide--D-alanyl-D-alanine ligase [Lentisphaerota bacterium]